VALLGLPNPVLTGNRLNVPAVEAVCILLHRLAHPMAAGLMVKFFGRSRTAISRIATFMSKFIHLNFRHLLQWPTAILTQERLVHYAWASHRVVGVMPNVIGYIDGTLRQVCRPTHGQRSIYTQRKVISFICV
jgi:hypothetical protein